MIEEQIGQAITILSVCGGVTLLMLGVAQIVKAVTLARKIEQAIINQIEDMVKAKMEQEKEKAKA